VLVDAGGNLFNCTEAPYVAGETERGLQIGHVDDEAEDAEKRAVLGDFNASVADGRYPCATCRMLPVCGGACPKGWLEGWRPCPSALYNMPDRLLLAYAATVRDAEPVATA
jgi:uncharacterized protein